jgi:membrane dipeptidase
MTASISRAQQLHQEAFIIDGLEVCRWSGSVFRNMQAGGLSAVNATVSIIEGFEQTMRNLAWWRKAFERHAGLIMPVYGCKDIIKAKQAGKTGIIMGFQNLSPIEDDLDRLSLFHDLGIRVMQLTYMEANYAGQGCLERIDAGLTNFGLEAVEEMNRLGLLIDLSHVGHRTTMDAIEASQPAGGLYPCQSQVHLRSPRNKPDEAIKAVAAKGGVIGATVFPPFCPRAMIPA